MKKIMNLNASEKTTCADPDGTEFLHVSVDIFSC